ncbi:MAG: DUF4232 domain-containing protein [Candidatus Dormibacteraceae bacterium]
MSRLLPKWQSSVAVGCRRGRASRLSIALVRRADTRPHPASVRHALAHQRRVGQIPPPYRGFQRYSGMSKLLPLLASLGLGLLLVSCGNPQSRTTSTPTPSASPRIGTPSSSTPGASAGAGHPVSSSECAGDQLSVSAVSDGTAGGHGADILLITNTATSICQIGGYPGVDGLFANGAAVHAQRTLSGYLGGIRSGSIPILSLAPGQVGSAVVEGLNLSTTGAPCPRFATFAVTPPNTTTTSQLVPPGGSFSYCQGSLQVHPMVAGTSGDQGS